MVSRTPEAMERRRKRDRDRQKVKREARRVEKAKERKAHPVTVHVRRNWHIGPRMPEKSKAELRAMFADAAANTALL